MASPAERARQQLRARIDGFGRQMATETSPLAMHLAYAEIGRDITSLAVWLAREEEQAKHRPAPLTGLASTRGATELPTGDLPYLKYGYVSAQDAAGFDQDNPPVGEIPALLPAMTGQRMRLYLDSVNPPEIVTKTLTQKIFDDFKASFKAWLRTPIRPAEDPGPDPLDVWADDGGGQAITGTRDQDTEPEPGRTSDVYRPGLLPKPTPAKVRNLIDDLPTCIRCDRPMRPRKTKTGEWPGTVSRAAGGLCGSCYTIRTRDKKQTVDQLPQCASCRLPMRPIATFLDDYPGTVQYAGTTCSACQARHKRAAQKAAREQRQQQKEKERQQAEQSKLAALQAQANTTPRVAPTRPAANGTGPAAIRPAPAGLDPHHQQLRAQLDELIADRRRRGIPAEGQDPQMKARAVLDALPHCDTCARPMRPHLSLADEYPEGTVQQCSKTRCRTCIRKTSQDNPAPKPEPGEPAPETEPLTRTEMERARRLEILHQGKQRGDTLTKAATQIGVTRHGLYQFIKRWGSDELLDHYRTYTRQKATT